MPQLTRTGLVVVIGLAGCARMGEPPGGPPDAAAPLLIGTYPDSTMVLPNFTGNAEFRFDEIVNEGGSPNFGLGSGDLEKLVVLSPSNNVPNVSWKKSRIAVRPKEGWQPNRVYRVELLPGISDLRNNRSTGGRIITFTTGAALPSRFLEGRIVDWSSGRPEARGLVEAALLPDTLKYRSVADSTGRFRIGPLPEGTYVVAGVLDQNRNTKRDSRESYDTVTIVPGRDSVGELWAFKHDTVPARLQSVATNDSLSITAQFNQQLNPYQRVSADSVRVLRLPDSVAVAVEAVLTKEAYDSVYAARPRSGADSAGVDSVAAKQRADSIARADSVARADSIRQARLAQLAPGARRRGREIPEMRTEDNAPLKTKPPLYDRLIIRVKDVLNPSTKYLVQLFGVENVTRVPGKMALGFEVPKPKVDSTPKADSAQADSARPAPPAGPTRRPTPPPPPPAPPPPPPAPPPQRSPVHRANE